MKGVEEIGEINEELKVESSQKGKTESENEQDLQIVEIIEEKQQHVEETTIQKEYHSINEQSNRINKGYKISYNNNNKQRNRK